MLFRSIELRNITLWGGNYGIDIQQTPGARIWGTYGDAGTTLIRVQDCGERIAIGGGWKQKPVLTATADDLTNISITAIADNGTGQLRITTASSVTAAGLTTGQKIATDKIVGVSGTRFTATVIDATHVDLLDVAWASQTLSPSADMSLNPGGSSALTAILDDGGKVRVQCAAALPFLVGHYALLGLGGVTGEGFYPVLTRTSSTDFTLDVATTPAILAATLASCELAVMTGNRLGPGVVGINCDGAKIEGSSKGGSGVYCDAANWTLEASHEGGIVGELDRADPSKVGLYLGGQTTRFVQFSGAYKSTGTAVRIEIANNANVAFFGTEFNDRGYAAIDIRSGGASFYNPRGRGDKRIRLASGVGVSNFYDGEFGPENLIGANTDKARIAFWGAPDASGDRTIRRIVAGTLIFQAWKTGTATEVGRMTNLGFQIQPPGPYANDAAAAAAGVALNELYRVTGGGTAWRQV